MRLDFLDLLRCPYCGGRLAFVASAYHRREGDELRDGILGCHCCAFPVVAGIPVLHLEPSSHAARGHVDRGEPEAALLALFGIDDEGHAAAVRAAIADPEATYRRIVEALGPAFEGGYFLYRFSDPTYVVAESVVRAIAAAVFGDAGPAGARALDVCGGSGHLTRALADAVVEPVLADLYFSKLWLAKRFTAPSCQPVCCDAHAPLPFEAGAFRFAVCSDAFHYIWTKRLLAAEMMRAVGADGVVALTHVHNARQWNPSAGMTLPPEGYADLFAGMNPHVYPERRLLDEIVAAGRVDLARTDGPAAVDADPALTLVATRCAGVFASHAARVGRSGPLWLNPLYATEPAADGLVARLRLPSADYAEEYGACRRYLPEAVAIPAAVLEALPSGVVPASAADLVRRRVLLRLPDRYA